MLGLLAYSIAEAEVNYFELGRVGEKQIFRLNVPVNDLEFFVHVMDA